MFHRILEIFQYTASYYSRKSIGQVGIIFVMNVSPITMHHFRENVNFFSVIVQLFSILGGLFMIAKIFDTYLSSLWTPKKVNEVEDVPLGDA